MTPFTDIYPLALTEIRDYRLDKLAKEDVESFKKYLSRFLINASLMFDKCKQELDYVEEERQLYFVNDLTNMEKSILADYMIICWFDNTVNDIIQINEGLQGRDKKMYSKATNLREKVKYSNILREKVKQRIVDYQLKGLSI